MIEWYELGELGVLPGMEDGEGRKQKGRMPKALEEVAHDAWVLKDMRKSYEDTDEEFKNK